MKNMMVHSLTYASFWTLLAVPFTTGFTSSSSRLHRNIFSLKRHNFSACRAIKPRVVKNSIVDLTDQLLPTDDKPNTEQGLLLDFVTMVEDTPLGELQDDEVELLREVMTALPNEVGGSEGAKMVQGLLYRLFGEWQAGVTADDVERIENWEPSKTDFSAAIAAWENADVRESATNILSLVSDQREFYQNGLETVKPDLETMQSAFRALASSKERGTESLAAQLFESLSDYDVVPDPVIYSSLISIVAKSRERGAAARAENWLRQAVDQYPPKMSKDGVLSGIGVETFNVVITSWAKSNDKDGPTRAEQLISYMDAVDQKHSSLGLCNPNAKSFTSLIDAYAQQNDWEGVNQAEMTLNRLLDQYLDGNDDLEPNVATWTIVISAWSRLSRSNYKGAASKAERLLQRMESLHAGGRISFRPDAISYVSCMNALAFSNTEEGIARAEELLDELNEKFLDGDDAMKPTARSIKVIIDSWIKIDNMKRAEDVLDRYEAMLEADEDPKTAEELQDIYRSMLFGWTKCKDPTSAQDYLDHMVEQGMKPDSFCFDRIIESNTQNHDEGSLSRSQKVFELMEECRRKGDIKPNERVYTSFIRALTRGKADKLHQKVFLILQRMRVLYDEGNKGIQPTSFTFNAVLNACAESRSDENASSNLEAFKIALGVFNDLRKSREGPDHVSFGNMIKCAALLPEGEQRNSVVSTTFRLCCEKGFVNAYVIRDLQYSASVDLWRSLLECPAGDVDMERLPLSWSAKFERKEEKPQRPERTQRPQQRKGNFRR